MYKYYENDIYIISYFDNASNLSAKIKEVGIFKDVYNVEGELPKVGVIRKLKKLYNLLRRKFAGIDKIPAFYDQISTFSLSPHLTRVLGGMVIERGGKIVILEEGLGSYNGNLFSEKKSDILLEKVSKLFNRMICSTGYRNISKHYYFQPELVIGIDNSCKLRIPSISSNPRLKNVLNEIFEYKSERKFSDIDFILFDQPIVNDGIVEINVDEDTLTSAIISELSIGNYLIKLHPRDESNKYAHLDIKSESIINSHYPWELVYLNENLEETILISIMSSASFSPNIVFNNVHKIILLYKMVGIQNEDFEVFIKEFRQITKSKIIMPESFEEFQHWLSGYCAK